MAEKLTPEKIEEIAKNYEKIQDGKVPIIKSEKETIKLDYGSLDNLRPETKSKAPEKRVLPLIPPSDPRLLMQIAPFMDDTLEQLGFKDRKALAKVMYENMTKYGGLGLAANQLGLPYRMFVMGGHPESEDGKVRYVFIDLVSKLKLERAEKAKEKMIKEIKRRQGAPKIVH